MNKMIIANLVHRPIRSIISVLAIGLEVTLILMIVGLSLGILNDSKTRQAGIGFDLMVQPPGATVFGGMSGAPLSIKIADKLSAVDGVAAVAPVVTQVAGSGLEVLYGIDLNSWQKLSGPFRYIEGGPFQGPDDAIVDDIYAESKHAHVGDALLALNHKFRISGIVEHGAGGRKLFPMRTLQDITGATDKVSIFYVKLKNQNDTEKVSDEIKAIPGMQDYTIRSLKEYLSQMTPDHIPGFSIFLNVVIGVSMIIGFMVIFQSMYTAVIERTREIGILKSLGASKLYIVNVILRETSLLAVGGIVLGTAISSIAERILLRALPTLRIMWDWQWVVMAAILALVGALIGAFYPALKAAQKDPIDALAYD
jgi:putative ABC transport system permease protein